MGNNKNKTLIAAGLLVMSLTMACNSALAPILAEIGKFFPNASDTSIQIVLQIINLICLPGMLLEPYLEPHITKKNIGIIGTILMLAGALLPQVLNTELWMLYAASGIIGLGLSFVVVVSSSLISDYFTGLDKSRVMGFQSIFVSIGGALIAKGSGMFTAMAGWRRGYLVFLICIPIVLIVLATVPKGEVTKQEEKKEKAGISKEMVYFGLLCLVTGIFVATFNSNISMYIDRKGIGDASTAGTVASIMQIVGIAGGLVLGSVVKRLRRFTIGGCNSYDGVGNSDGWILNKFTSCVCRSFNYGSWFCNSESGSCYICRKYGTGSSGIFGDCNRISFI